jgi:hypothetical protein
MKTDSKKPRKGQSQSFDFRLLFQFGKPGNRIERIVQEVRIDLDLQGIEFELPFAFAFLRVQFHEFLDSFHHFVEGNFEFLDFVGEDRFGFLDLAFDIGSFDPFFQIVDWSD